ncbi:MAG TPA: porin [Polyangiaceae bacterium]|nr:porin [Polyangiaceae bacterium]
MEDNRALRKVRLCAQLAFGVGFLFARAASAEVTIAKADKWEVFSQGRVQAFVSYARGGGLPNLTDTHGNLVRLDGGGLSGLDANREKNPNDPNDAGTISSMRVKSGFTGNVLGLGLRRPFNDQTTFKAYMALTTIVESEARRKYRPVFPDMREGYLELEGPWGDLLVGRALTLFSRGATEITYLYAYAYGLGYPGSVDGTGPAAGHIGFGVLANGFAAGVKYATPKVAGLQLSVGAYDPSALVGRNWERTQWLRPEAELTYDIALGQTGKIHLFGNGGWQKVYADGDLKSTDVWGAGYGGRFEFGPVHLGLAGHYGKGLGINYALDPSDASTRPPDKGAELRTFDGYYGQLQVALGKVDISAGAGVTRIYRLPDDRLDVNDNDGNPDTPAGDDDAYPGEPDPPGFTILNQELGLSAGVVYHLSDFLHLDFDYFRARFEWYGGSTASGFFFHPSASQTVNFFNAGVTADW